MAESPLRTWVLIDSQNLYKDAREAFHDPKNDPASYGQIYPLRLAELLTGRGPKDTTRRRQLDQVHVYTGFPSPSREPKANAAHMRQRAAWERDGVKPFPRVLRYPKDYPKEKAYEKGVDVHLAVNLVFAASRRFFDVGIVCSTDTDIVPALEAVCELRRAWGEPKIEVAAWADHPGKKRLRVDGQFMYCHQLSRDDYEKVRDQTNYMLPAT